MDASTNLNPELNVLLQQDYIKKASHESLPLDIYNYRPKVHFKNKWTPLVLCCRGLVIHRHTGHIISRPLPKFFNHNEKKPSFYPVLPMESLSTPPKEAFVISEKMDGSLGMWFWFEEAEAWLMVTRGNFHSSQAVFGDKVAREKGLHLPGRCVKGKTYCFEIIDPANKILVDYGTRAEIILLGIINTKTGHDTPVLDLPPIAKTLGISAAPFWKSDSSGPLATLEGWLKRDILGKEGYVVRFENGTGIRVKLKFSNYLSFTKKRTYFSKLTLLEWLINNPAKQIEDGINAMPDEFFEEAKEIERRYLTVQNEGKQVLKGVGSKFRGRQIGGIGDEEWKDVGPELVGKKGLFKDLGCKYLKVLKGKLKAEVQAVEKEFGLAWAEKVLREEYKPYDDVFRGSGKKK